MATLEDRLTLAAFNVMSRGNTKLIWGTYTGTGTCGKAHPNTLTFDGKPLCLVMRPAELEVDTVTKELWYGSTQTRLYHGSNGASTVYFTWTENSISWYAETTVPEAQWNASGRTYIYVALLGL